MKKTRRRLFFDLETSPNIGFFWRAGHDISVGTHDIIKERAIICVCWKWAGQKRVHSLTWDGNQDDGAMLKKFLAVIDEADEVIAHNGDRFDIKWLRTRCLKHGIPMMPDYTSIDTLKEARGRFNFNSNRLDYIGRFLGLGGKRQHEGFDLWRRVILDKSQRALTEMVRYCKRDVELLEEIFDKLSPYLKPKSSVASHTHACPECASFNIVINKHRVTAHGYKKTTFQCNECGKYHTIATSRLEKQTQL